MTAYRSNMPRFATSEESRLNAKYSDKGSAILLDDRFADAQDSCFQGTKRSN